MTFVLFSYLLCFPSKNTSKLFFPISHPTFFMLSSSCSSIRSANRSITVESVLLTTNRLPLSITLSVKPRIRKTIYVHHLTLRRLFFTISPQFMRCQYMRAIEFVRIFEHTEKNIHKFSHNGDDAYLLSLAFAQQFSHESLKANVMKLHGQSVHVQHISQPFWTDSGYASNYAPMIPTENAMV